MATSLKTSAVVVCSPSMAAQFNEIIQEMPAGNK